MGVAEQGALLVDAKRSYGPKFTGDPANVGLKAKVARALEGNEFREIISDEPDKLYTCSIHIKNEAKEGMSLEDKMDVYRSAKRDIEANFAANGYETPFFALAHNCMEVMSTEISKANGLNMMLHDYRRDYDIAGLMYGGDAENDKVAMTFVSKMAEVPGVNCHNFTPVNAQEAISTQVLEKWKRKNRAAHQHFVERGTKKNFAGVTELIRRAMDRKVLCGMVGDNLR